MPDGTVPSGKTDERPRSMPEIRGFAAIPRERTAKYSPASYSAQYGIPKEDAKELVARSSSHQEVERAINQIYSADPDLKARALDPSIGEREKAERVRAREEEVRARRIAEREAKARARRDRLRREMFGMPSEDEAG